MITLDEGVTDEQGVTPKPGVSDTRSIVAGDNIVVFLLLEDGGFLLQEGGDRIKLERQDGGSIIETERVFILGGQSNAVLLFQQSEAEFETVMDTYWETVNHLINGATSGSAALKESANDPVSDPWWIDDGGVAGQVLVYGPAWDAWEAAALAQIEADHTIKAIVWDQGESDFGDVASGGAGYRARYKAALLSIFNEMRTIVGEVPVVIVPIGRRGDTAVSNTGYQSIREVQQELALETEWIHLSPEKYDLDDDGGAHLSNAAYDILAPRVARKTLSVCGESVSGGVNGPEVVSVSRSGTTVTVTIDHDGGTDFTPTTGITGFVYMDDGAIVFDGITDTAARVDATTIEFDLDSEPSGVETFYYFYNVLNDIDNTKILKDNDTIPLPLRATKITDIEVDEEEDVSVQSIIPSAVLDLDARILDSYDGTGQFWRNLVPVPADGTTQSANDFTLGNTSGAANDDPLFSGTAGTNTGKFTYNSAGAADFFQFAGAVTAFFRDMHKDTPDGSDFAFSGEVRFIQNDQTQVYFATSNTATVPGLRVTTNASEKLQLIQRHDGGANVSFTSDDTLVNNTVYAFVITHSHSTNTTKCKIESGTIDSKSHTFAASTTNANDVPAIGAEADGGVQCADNTEFMSFQAYNSFLTDQQMSDIITFLQARRA